MTLALAEASTGGTMSGRRSVRQFPCPTTSPLTDLFVLFWTTHKRMEHDLSVIFKCKGNACSSSGMPAIEGTAGEAEQNKNSHPASGTRPVIVQYSTRSH